MDQIQTSALPEKHTGRSSVQPGMKCTLQMVPAVVANTRGALHFKLCTERHNMFAYWRKPLERK